MTAAGLGLGLYGLAANAGTEPGTLAFDKAHYARADTPTVTVGDADLNSSNVTIDTAVVNVASASDPDGISVNLRETGPNTGVFNLAVPAISFSETASDDAQNRLKVAAGDQVTATYVDASPSTTVTATARMFKEEATVAFNRLRYQTGGTHGTAEVTVADVDRNASPTVADTLTAKVTSATSDSTTGVQVTLAETAVNSGVFKGTTKFNATASTPGTGSTPPSLKVVAGEKVIATYEEPHFAPATSTTARTAEAFMHVDNTSVPPKIGAVDVYALTDSVTLTVDDIDGNLDKAAPDTITANFKSDADGTGINLGLTETGNDTGVFTRPGITFSTTASGASTLKAAHGNKLTLTYQEPTFAGTTAARTDLARIAGSATAVLNQARYRLATDNASATATVTDADRNLNDQSVETVTVTASSTSDPNGLPITLTETGLDTGVFSNTSGLTFKSSAPSSGNALHAASGDTVSVAYPDGTTAEGTPAVRTATATMFVDSATVAVDKARYQVADTATITVTDIDGSRNRASAETVSVNLKSSTDPTGITVTATETGVDTGIFRGTSTFRQAPATGSGLLVQEGDTITATYNEPAYAGAAVTPARTATAVVFEDDADADLDQDTYGLNATAKSTVTDADRNTNPAAKDTVTAKVTSDADPVGVTLTLLETGNGTGIFEATSTFTTGPSTATALKAGSADTITLTYLEPAAAGGSTTVSRTDTARMAQNGTAVLDQGRYQRTDDPVLTVTDADANTDDEDVEEVSVTLKSTSDPVGITVVLDEVDLDDDDFTATVDFTTGASDPGGMFERPAIKVAAGDTVTLTYNEASTLDGVPAARTTTALMYQDTATAALNRARYQQPDTATATVVDADRNDSPTVADSVTGILKSSADPAGVQVTLNETGVNTGVFTGTATFNTTASTGSSLRVAQGNTVTFTYEEPVFDPGVATPTTPRPATATMFTDGATVPVLVGDTDDSYGIGDTATITVDDVDGNLNPTGTDTVVANLKSASDPTGISVTLTETGNNTGAFTGTATFTENASTATALKVASGDTVTATYLEPMFAGGTTARTDTARMAKNGAAAFEKLHYQLSGTDGSAKLIVRDADLNSNSTTSQSVSVNLKSTSDATGISVTLAETGVNSDEFTANASFTAGASAAPALKAAAGDVLTLTYQDATTFDAVPSVRTATATMYVDSATVSFDKGRYGLGDTATVTVVDADRNTSADSKQSFPVKLTSSSDSVGVDITVTETGDNTGVFSGPIAFNETASRLDTTPRQLRVAADDSILATYKEPKFDGGTVDRTAAASTNVGGSAALDSGVYDLADTATATVSDPDLNTSSSTKQTVPVTLKSTSDTTGVTLTLTETGNNTGTFTGTATFTTGGSAGTTLHVAGGDAVTLAYRETTTFGAGAEDRTGQSRMAVNGTATLGQPGEGGSTVDAWRYDTNDVATLTVVDRDLNTVDNAIGSVSVKLHSTADPVGITVTLNEQGTNSSTFRGTATFSPTSSSGSQLKVAPGDTVTMTYAEATTFEGPNANRTDTAAIFADNATAALDRDHYGVSDTATATVTDADANLHPTVAEEVTATLTSESDNAGEELTLTETGVNTGVFTGIAGFIAGPAAHADRVTIAPGDDLTLSYREPNASGIGTTTRSDTAKANTNGVAALNDTKYDLTETPTLTVTDTDLNTNTTTVQTVPVNLKSSSDTTGVAVTLTETGPNTGVFEGTAGFVTAPSNGTSLKTASGDVVTLTYAEATTFEGPPANRTAMATMATTSVPSFDKKHYAQGDTATLRVTDPDRNSNDATPQTLVANLKSTSDATGLSIVLTETGNNTGLFSGTATFNATASAGTSLKVAAGDTITLSDTDATTFEGPTATRTATATMFSDGASAALDKPRYQATDTATATVTDTDRNSSAANKQTITATLRSSTDGTGVTVTLEETGNDTGVFAGNATFTTGSSGPSTLKVASGDQLTLTYAESAFTGTAPTRTATAAMAIDGTVGLDKVRYQSGDTAVLTVTDNDLNTTTAAAQSVPVNLKSASDSAGVTVTLTETGTNTGVFSGTATFTAGSSAGTTLKALAGDLLTMAYAETTTFAGPAANRTTPARMTTNGTSSLDKARYAANETPVLTVTDPDLNTNAGSAQTVPVNLKSTSDATGVSVTLTETGIDTGVFTGTAAFTTGPSSGSTLKVAGGDAVTLTYLESSTFGGAAADRVAAASMATNGTVDLDKAQYTFNQSPVVTVTDPDLNTNSGTAQSVPVNLKSTADATGVTVTLAETGANTGIFTGSASLTTGSSSGTTLKVTDGDTITATYAEASTFEGPAANRTDTATAVRPPAPSTLALDPTSGSSPKGSALTMTATVRDQHGSVSPGVTVRFSVTGANTASGAATTNGSGVATFSYTGANAGTDSITAFADTDGNGSRTTDEPRNTSSYTWTTVAAPAGSSGYWLAGADGRVYAFGDAPHLGDASRIRLNAPIVALVGTPSHKGYWLAGADGAVFAFGDAPGLGSMAGKPLQKPIVGMAALPNGKGYWLVATDGGIFSFGDARFQGSMGGQPLNQPMVGIASTPTGNGYWTVAADGGIFSFGDATFQGSMGGQRLNKPVVGMTAVTRTDRPQGYRLVASDGGIFSFNAPFFGSLGSTPLNQPINGMSTVPSGEGYRMVAADGGVFSFGPAAPAKGSAASTPKSAPVAAMDGF